MKTMDKFLKKVLDDQIIEKYISKFIGNKSNYIKEEAKQHILLAILESNYLEADKPLNYIIGLIINQLNSRNSTFYKQYMQYYRDTEVINDNKLILNILYNEEGFTDDSTER